MLFFVCLKVFFSNGNINNVVSTLPNVVKFHIENDSVVSTLSNVQLNVEIDNVDSTLHNSDVDVRNVVSTLILGCLMS